VGPRRLGTEIVRLEEGVTALAALPDRQLAVGFSDDMIRLWDLMTRAETVRFEASSVWALCALPVGRLIESPIQGGLGAGFHGLRGRNAASDRGPQGFAGSSLTSSWPVGIGAARRGPPQLCC
jgi:hypothetical protein